MFDSLKRGEKIDKLVDQYVQNSAASQTELIKAHPELMPELGEKLKIWQMIQDARCEVDSYSAPQSAGNLEATLAPTKDDRSDTPGTASQRIGPYKLLQQIGKGGMGTVWMAEQ